MTGSTSILTATDATRRWLFGRKIVSMAILCMLLFSKIPSAKGFSFQEGKEGDDETATAIRAWAHLADDMIATSFGFLSPPGVARALSMLMTAMWNAAAPFDKHMVPVIVERFPPQDEDASSSFDIKRLPRKEADVRKAVSIAAFLTLAEIFDMNVED